VSEPEEPDPAEIARNLQQATNSVQFAATLRLLRRWSAEVPSAITPESLEVLVAYFEDAPVTLFVRGARGTGKAHLASVLRAEATLTAEGKVTKPTPLQQYFSLPCGQQLAVLVVILLVALSVELPRDVQDQIWGLITVLGAAIWTIGRITRS
jgi:hypothetical protein